MHLGSLEDGVGIDVVAKVGAFTKHGGVIRLVAEEKKSHPRRRQLVSVLLLDPSGTRLCMCQHENNSIDGMYKVSPPQGSIEPCDKYLTNAVVRSLRSELSVTVSGNVSYLGSMVRVVGQQSSRITDFSEYHHHWVVGFARTRYLYPRSPIARSDWYLFSEAQHMLSAMSLEKGLMFKTALDELLRISGDPLEICRKKLS